MQNDDCFTFAYLLKKLNKDMNMFYAMTVIFIHFRGNVVIGLYTSVVNNTYLVLYNIGTKVIKYLFNN